MAFFHSITLSPLFVLGRRKTRFVIVVLEKIVRWSFVISVFVLLAIPFSILILVNNFRSLLGNTVKDLGVAMTPEEHRTSFPRTLNSTWKYTMKEKASDNGNVHQKTRQNFRLGKYLRVAVRSGVINAAICFEKDVRNSFFGWIENEQRDS